MLAIFPTPYPDELLYSIIARYNQYMGFKQSYHGSISYEICSEVQHTIPCDIDHLIEALPPDSLFTSDYLIREHTLYRLYAVFLNPELRKQLLHTFQTCKHEKRSRRITKEFHFLHFEQHKRPPYLRYCPQCVSENRNRYGETYWRRLFQIASVKVCPTHDVFLVESLAKNNVSDFHMPVNVFFRSAEMMIAKSSPLQALNLEKEIDQELRSLATTVEWILQNDVPDTYCPIDRYQAVFKAMNLYKLDGFLNIYALSESSRFFRMYGLPWLFDGHHQNEIWEVSGIYMARQILAYTVLRYPLQFQHKFDETIFQLFTVINYPRQDMTPSEHLITLGGLGIKITDFVSSLPLTVSPPPLPCLNIFCRFYAKKKIVDYHIDNCHEPHLWEQLPKYDPSLSYMIDATCECGFNYRRHSYDMDSLYRIDAINGAGSVWLMGLLILWKNESLSMSRIAERIGIPLFQLQKSTVLFRIPPRPIAKLRELVITERSLKRQYDSESSDQPTSTIPTDMPSLPTPYPDELLYSLIARYADHHGITNNLIVRRQLFGSSKVDINISWSNGLEALSTHLHGNYPLPTYTDLMDELTLFRLYAPFLDVNKITKLDTYLQHLSGDAPKLSAQWQTDHDHSLSYCPLCVINDRETHGKTYWRRLFQAKSVLVCPVHDVFLEISDAVISKRLIHSAESTIQSMPYPRFLDLHQPSHVAMKVLAKETAWILGHDLQPETGFLSNQYKQLVERFIMQSFISESISQGDIIRTISTQLADRYSPELWQLFQCEFDTNDTENWIGELIYKPRNKPLLRHLLLLVGLDMPVAKFMDSRLPNPRLTLNRPCLNPFCQHHRKLRISEVEIDRQRDETRFIYSCECGFAYYRLPKNMGKDIYYMDGVSRWDSQHLLRFFLLWFNESLSMKSIAEKMGVSLRNLECILPYTIGSSVRTTQIACVSKKIKAFLEEYYMDEGEIAEGEFTVY